jgi:hypothetical protein
MGSVLKDKDLFQLFIRFSPQGRVVKLLDLFESNEMNKRKRGENPLSRRAIKNSFT